MSLYEHYKSTPESIGAQRDAAVKDSTQLVGVRTQVMTDHLKAASGLGGIFAAIPQARQDPAYINADRAAKLKLIASASLLQWANSITTYDTGIDRLNKEYDDAKGSGFGVDADQYYQHGTQTPAQRDAAYHHALGAAEAALLARLNGEKARLDATLDDDATTAKTTLNTDPSDANLTKLFEAGLFPVEATLSFSGIDVSKVDLAKLVANLKALGLLPDNVDAAALQEMQSILGTLGTNPQPWGDAAALLKLADLMKDLDPATLQLFMAVVPAADLDKWNTAIEHSGGILDNDYKLALSNLMLQGLCPAEVRTFMSSLTSLQPGMGQLKDAQWTWLQQELGADAAAMDEINQGGVGDCWFIASIGAELLKNPDFVKDHIHDNGNGTYTVTFYDDGEPVEVTVDGEIPTNPGGGAAGAHTDPNWDADGPGWLAIYEKAYANFKGGSYEDINGGWGDEGMSDLTGHDADREGSGPFGGPSLDDIQESLADGHPVTVGTTDDAGFWWWEDDDDERIDGGQLVSHHEYIVKEVVTLPDGAREIVLLNPWGPSGSAPYEVHLSEDAYRMFIREVATDD